MCCHEFMKRAFALSFGIGLGLSLALPGLAGDGPSEDGKGVSTADAEFQTARMLVKRRDAALIAGDAGALAALTTEHGSARRQDNAVFANYRGKIATLRTGVTGVRVIDAQTWEVMTVQEEFTTTDGRFAAPGKRRCSLWRMDGKRERLHDAAACPG